jgi:spermidine synthase
MHGCRRNTKAFILTWEHGASGAREGFDAMMSVLGRWLGGAPLYRGAEVEVREKDGVRTLHLGSETIQSAMRLDTPHALELAYTRAMMGFLLFASTPERILIIGLGGGSLSKFLYHRLPQARQTVIEISSEVIAVARRFFFLPPDDGRLSVELGEGAQYVGRCKSSVDVMLVDAYDGRSLAAAFKVDAFYVAARAALSRGGVLAMNLWSSDWAFDHNLQRIERAFSGRCICLPAERPGNVIVFAFAEPPRGLHWQELNQTARTLEQGLGLPFPQFVAGLKKMNPHDAHGLRMDA